MKENARFTASAASVASATLAALVLLFGLASCAGKPETAREPKPGIQSGQRFSLELTPGPQYSADRRILWYRYTVQPQVAVWVESPEGRYIDTIYATEAVVTGTYNAAPKKGRPEALPVWSHLGKSGVDAVSSPTAIDAPVFYGSDLAARLPAGSYVIKLETNRSYDWNASYTKKNSGVNGQPSVVYRADIVIGGDSVETRFIPIGTGSVSGADGDIRPGLGGVDTALELFSSTRIAYIAR